MPFRIGAEGRSSPPEERLAAMVAQALLRSSRVRCRRATHPRLLCGSRIPEAARVRRPRSIWPADRKSVRLRVEIDEGEPVRIQECGSKDSRICPRPVRKKLADLPLAPGNRAIGIRYGRPRTPLAASSVTTVSAGECRYRRAARWRSESGDPHGPRQRRTRGRGLRGVDGRLTDRQSDHRAAGSSPSSRRLIPERLLKTSQRRLTALGV
jgi:hypothetical protein